MPGHRQAPDVDPASVSRRDLVTGTAGLLVAGVAGATVSNGAAAATTLGGSGQGNLGMQGAASGIELVGRINQVGASLTGFGYLTKISGLSLDQIFIAGADHNEATARFTFYATATVESLQSLDTMRVAIASGQVAFYLQGGGGASFDDPLSFAQGERIALDDASVQNVLNVTAPGTAVTGLYGDLVRVVAEPFALDGKRVRLGHVGLRSRLVAPGRGTLVDPAGPTAVLAFGGNISNPA